VRTLYVSQNGMAENLGQSQVLPYLRGLARRGVDVDLFSYELATLTADAREELAAGLARDGIRWHPLVRTMGTKIPTKMAEAARGVAEVVRSAVARRPDIIHGRSYFATAVCDAVGGISRRSKVLFDCRGMIGDEYIDCGHWTTDRLEYRMVKTYEKRLFRRSDGIVVLTRALQRWLRDTSLLGPHPKTEVIPCCVDLEKFQPRAEARARIRRELGVEDATVIVYSGSLGTWYLEEEMTAFAAELRRRLAAESRRVAFVCLTPSNSEPLKTKLLAAGFPEGELIMRRIPPPEMPNYLSAGDIGLSFIQSCFSKKGSSPTKVAEYLACGNVAVLNGDIGDQADLSAERDACVVLQDFSAAEIEAAAAKAVLLLRRPRPELERAGADVARRHFSLEEVGVARYAALYESLVSA
jgi:glycosyltransferase involved in cell wall biosynthesis